MEKKRNIPYSIEKYPTPECRVRWIVDTYFSNATEFSTRTKINKGSVSRILNKRIKLNERMTDAICKNIPDISKRWLLTGETDEPKVEITEIPEVAELKKKLAEAESNVIRLQRVIDALLDNRG